MDNNANRLFVGGLAYEATPDTLRAFISAEGFKVVDAFIVKDRETSRSKGYGFVTLSSDHRLDDAIQRLHGKEMDGRTLTVNKATPKTPAGRR